MICEPTPRTTPYNTGSGQAGTLFGVFCPEPLPGLLEIAVQLLGVFRRHRARVIHPPRVGEQLLHYSACRRQQLVKQVLRTLAECAPLLPRTLR